jgi:hypothetical protein
MIPVLLAIAAAALYLLPLIVPKPPPDDVALPPLGPAVAAPPAGPDFVSAVRAMDSVVAYLRDTGQYRAAQVDAARVLRAAVVEGATPKPEASL